MTRMMIRLRAALIHLGLSALVVGVLFLLFWFVWYPSPLFVAADAGRIFALILAVDLVLGPLLTFIVYNPAKKSLRFDLGVIVLVQIAALAYGSHTLLGARPVYIAAVGDRFDWVQAVDVDAENLARSGRRMPWFGPEWVGTRPPDDPAEYARLVAQSEFRGGAMGRYPQYHVPLETQRDELLRHAQPIAVLRTRHPEQDAAITHWLRKNGVQDDQNAVFMTLVAVTSDGDRAVILDAQSARVIGIAPFRF